MPCLSATIAFRQANFIRINLALTEAEYSVVLRGHALINNYVYHPMPIGPSLYMSHLRMITMLGKLAQRLSTSVK